MSNQPPDAVAVLRESLESLRSTSHHLVRAERPDEGSHARFELAAANLRDACVKNLPALLDEIEQLRRFMNQVPMPLVVDHHVLIDFDLYPATKFIRVDGMRLPGDPHFADTVGAFRYLRSDAGKAAVERAKGGRS